MERFVYMTDVLFHTSLEDFVLAGGWTPHFLTKNYFDHCGSKDIDIVLKPTIMVKYKSIRKIMEKMGYRQTPNPFRFYKNLLPHTEFSNLTTFTKQPLYLFN